MKLIKMECPYCGANLEMDAEKKVQYCGYCGKQILIEDENVHKEITIKDEAKIKETEFKKQIYEDQKREKNRLETKKGSKILMFFIVICVILALGSFMNGKILAGIIALLQATLLLLADKTRKGAVYHFKGFRIPTFVFIIVAVILYAPYNALNQTEKKQQEYTYKNYRNVEPSNNAYDSSDSGYDDTSEESMSPTIESTFEATEIPEPTFTTTVEPTDTPFIETNEIRPELKKALDDYEEFIDKYIAFMQKYNTSNDTTSMMLDYLSMMTKLEEMTTAMDNIDESTLNAEEDKYYLEVLNRCNYKLTSAAISLD